MIERVYRTENITEYKEEKKTRRIKKTITTPDSYICGRCHTTFTYGSNKKDPEKCPECVCTKCGRSLMERPAHHKLCGYCWGMGTAGYTYHHPITKIEGKTEEKWIEETEIIKVPYTILNTFLVNPEQISYPKENVLRKFYIDELKSFLEKNKEPYKKVETEPSPKK